MDGRTGAEQRLRTDSLLNQGVTKRSGTKARDRNDGVGVWHMSRTGIVQVPTGVMRISAEDVGRAQREELRRKS